MSERARRRLVALLAAAELVVAVAAVGHRWIATSTEASFGDAVRRFRSLDESSRATAAPTPSPAPPAPTPKPSPTPKGAKPKATAKPTATPPPTPTPMLIEPPDPGVYSWRTQGWEEAPGIHRDFPPTSVRTITRRGAKGWQNDHEYSAEHREWFDLSISDHGVDAATIRTRISFGPFVVDETITFNPPARFAVFPFAVGQRWQGSFTGATSGTYTGRTFEHTTMRVGREDVEVWGVEVHMMLEGESSGEVDVRLWVAPRYRLTVREEYKQTVASGPGTYRGEWTVTLEDTRPRR